MSWVRIEHHRQDNRPNPCCRNLLAQKAELIALTRDLELSQGKNINIYIDSKYDHGSP